MVRLFISTARRLAFKIASYGVMHLVVAVLVAFAITRDWRVALAVGVVEPFFQTIAYSIHDRVWHRIEHRRMLSGLEEASEAISAARAALRASIRFQIRSWAVKNTVCTSGSIRPMARDTRQSRVRAKATVTATTKCIRP